MKKTFLSMIFALILIISIATTAFADSSEGLASNSNSSTGTNLISLNNHGMGF